ncbi:hypothetical protein VXE29_16635, partial [Acinetobacter variabilis]
KKPKKTPPVKTADVLIIQCEDEWFWQQRQAHGLWGGLFCLPILENEQQLKVGFGLKNDVSGFRRKGIHPNGLIDLAKCFSNFGYNTQVGVQTAIALLFQRYFPKSKKISTSNWSVKQLSPQQINYAAADAYAARIIFEYLY